MLIRVHRSQIPWTSNHPQRNRRQPRQGASCNPDAGSKEFKGATVLSSNLLLVPTIHRAFRHHLLTPKYTVKERPVLELGPRSARSLPNFKEATY
jgi:hypothetical protein